MMHVDQLTALLVADNPRSAADRLLAWVLRAAHAEGGAILCVQPQASHDELVLLVSRNLSVDRAPDLRYLWATHRTLLATGRAFSDRQHSMAPVLEGGQVVALLYLDRAKHFHMERLTYFRLALAKAVAALRASGGADTVMGSFLSMSEADIKREQLLMALEQEQWCIARVARAIGVTRRTVYLRMRRLGLARDAKAGESSA